MRLKDLKNRVDELCARGASVANTYVVLHRDAIYLGEFEDPEDSGDGEGHWYLLDYVATLEKTDHID